MFETLPGGENSKIEEAPEEPEELEEADVEEEMLSTQALDMDWLSEDLL